MTIPAPRRHLSGKRGDTVRMLLDACVTELVERGYPELTVRSVATRAGVAAATAYTYFSSKEHLVAELFWRQMSQLPEPVAGEPATAATDVIRSVARLMTEAPALSAACTVAMLSDDPDVVSLRERVGLELHGRLVRALGPEAGEALALRIGMQWAGAMLYASLGRLSYDTIADALIDSTQLLLADRNRVD